MNIKSLGRSNTRNVSAVTDGYPEVYALGRVLPAKGIYLRHVNGLTMENVTIETEQEDVREPFVFEHVVGI